MNLFLIGWSPQGDADARAAARCLRSVVDRLGCFDPGRIETWRSPTGHAALACVAHEPERVGGVRYLHWERDRMALFSGRPFRWTDDEKADGRGPLDPCFYLAPANEWMADLDGRFVAVRCDDREGQLDVCGDALGAYPVYWGELDGTRWISNSTELVRTAAKTRELDLGVLASLLACGWSLSGHPVWTGVRRFARGVVHGLRAGRPDTRPELLGLERIARLPGAGFDPRRAARRLVSATAALSDWPGRPRLLQLSGGRDSRLVLAAALAGRVDFEVVSTGTPTHPDVRVARLLCTEAGVPHRLIPPDPAGAPEARPLATARMLALASGGASSLEDAAGYFSLSPGPLPLWLNGQGGEISRGYYGSGEGLGRDGLVAALLRYVAGSAEILSAQGRALVTDELRRSVDQVLDAGVAERDVPDVFYLGRRMACWAATGHGCPEYVKGDTAAPLWSRRLLADQLGAPTGCRTSEGFHRAVIEELSPPLTRLPYEDAFPPTREVPNGFAAVHAQVGQAASAQGSHPAWDVLDRSAVERLLRQDPDCLAPRERRSVWRLGTHFLSVAREEVA